MIFLNVIGLVAALITIYSFVTGRFSLHSLNFEVRHAETKLDIDGSTKQVEPLKTITANLESPFNKILSFVSGVVSIPVVFISVIGGCYMAILDLLLIPFTRKMYASRIWLNLTWDKVFVNLIWSKSRKDFYFAGIISLLLGLPLMSSM